jgi:polysaccharide pyruvyl transferase WcaK-like protein
MSELYKWLDRYSSAKITVSSSLHGCILALSLGSKLIAISKDWKIEGFLQMVNLEEAICNVDEIGKKAKHLELQKDVSKEIEKIKKENEYFAQKVKKLII